jgi:hypothetical protein
MKRCFAIVLCQFLTACVADLSTEETGAEINNGRVSGNHGVVALLNARGAADCSGIVIACNKVLTAEHCGVPSGIFVCDDPANDPPGCHYSVKGRVRHPTDDLAVITTTSPLVGIPVLPFRRSALDDTFLNRKIMIYGWSPRNLLNPTGRSEGLMNFSSTVGINRVATHFTLTQIAQFNNRVQGGDSGGPAMWLGEVIGVIQGFPEGHPGITETVSVGAHAQWIVDQINAP